MSNKKLIVKFVLPLVPNFIIPLDNFDQPEQPVPIENLPNEQIQFIIQSWQDQLWRRVELSRKGSTVSLDGITIITTTEKEVKAFAKSNQK